MSVLLLADSFGRANVWVTRPGVGVFLVFSSAYDGVAGIGTGLAMRSARDLSAVQQEGVFDVVKDWPAVGPPFALSIVGTPGWVAAVGALALAARRHGAPRREWLLIALSAVFLLGGTRSHRGRSPSVASSSPRSCTNGRLNVLEALQYQ